MVKKSSSGLDEYNRNARLKPAFLAVAPATIIVGTLVSTVSVTLGFIGATLSAAGFTYFLAQIGRDAGKSKEQQLYLSWGGKPSTVQLRHRDSTINLHTKERYLGCGSRLLGKAMPSPEFEKSFPEQADALYEAFGNILKERTRDREKFRLIFEELMNYGFRRNLWGLKRRGVLISVVSAAIASYWVLNSYFATKTVSPKLWTILVIEVLFVIIWVLVVTPSWVKLAADRYAERLLAASEQLVEL